MMIDNISWITAYPEMLLFGMACVIALFDLGVKTPLRGATYTLTLLTLAVGACSPALLNITVPRAGYSVHRDLVYGPAPRENLDIYVPDGLIAPAPVLLFFYGGNWDSGSKDLYLAFGQAFASEGFVVAIADYRLYPAVKYPVFLQDGAAAFRFVHGNAARFGGDPNRIFLAGHSAGAYNAIMLASDPHYLKDAGADISQLRGAIGLAGRRFVSDA